MDRRGRPRDVSPVALARAARDRDGGHSLAPPPPPQQRNFNIPAFFPDSPPTRPSAVLSPYLPGPSKPSYYDSRASISNSCGQPVASSSRLLPLPAPLPHHRQSLSTSPTDTLPRTHSSSSVLSAASEPNPPEPLTPPDNECAYACERPLEYYDSPPSPPRTLQDRMHVAYALEDMHLAKVLLLKLRGIEVSGDDDPRIAQVRDEDFSSSFVPPGGLRLDDATEARVREAERRAKEAQKRREREERLRRCERKWESSAQRLKSEKARVAREREEEARAQRRAEREARERERERARREEAARAARQHAQLRIAAGGQHRQLVCYDSLRDADARFPKPSPARERADEGAGGLFLYDIMPSPPSRPLSLSPPCSPSSKERESLSLPRAQRELALKHARSVSRSVPFSDVLAAMHGPLFDDDVGTRPHARFSQQQAELLAILMEPVDSSKVDVKGKRREDSLLKTASHQTREHAKAGAAARAVRSPTLESLASTSSGTSSSVSTVTRSGSWFSFGSRSSVRSASTALTTPSSSPRTSTKSILQSPKLLSTSPPSIESVRPPRQSSKRPAALTIPTSEHPLALPAPPKPKAREPLALGRGRPLTRSNGLSGQQSDDQSPPRPSGLVHRVSRSVSTLVDFAAQFQKAYVKATMFSAGVDLYSRSEYERSTSRSPSRSPVRSPRVRCASVPVRGRSGGLRPEGYRVCPTDVHLFTAASELLKEDASPQLQRTLIPLCTPSVDSIPAHERVFPLPPPLPRSPFRPAFPPGTVLSRLRPVANPLLVRLQALQNVCRVYGIEWQSRSRDAGGAGAGVGGAGGLLKEKVLGVAWEGVGRSGLGWEVRGAY
ncbi:hypothetical protein OH77DRAFT_1585265 [Trametes cingulata]|nr:hypothetical protein OH77DRAFT_1585265 [Trametes cingulata]